MLLAEVGFEPTSKGYEPFQETTPSFRNIVVEMEGVEPSS